ncbi:MAG: aminopeptidase P N-terminal domain-containing protein [Pseudobdellovibrionaceae bacterium]
MRKPLEDIRIFAERRARLAQKISGSALIVAAHPEYIRNHDAHFPYRQDSNLYYLTGFEEPSSILLFRPGQNPETVMFVRKRDKERETWDGFRFGPELTEKNFGIQKAYPIEEFERIAPVLLKGVDNLYYRRLKNPEADEKVDTVLETLKVSQGRTGYGLLPVFDADELLGEMRLIKSEIELNNQRQACEISAQAHIAAMKFTRPGKTERQIESVLMHHFLMSGSARMGYNAIVATGNNATTLHYNFNDQTCKAGELLLIDAGTEWNYFTGDITRTFPVSGKFTTAQAEVYQAVLDVQKEILSVIKPGITFKFLQDMGSELLTEKMLELGLFTGRREDIIAANQHRRYYPHGIGHWLGMDVHDAGLYYIKGEPRAIEENMCFTIEPGLYIPQDDNEALEKYRGIGARIEDNVRVTRDGHENMTSSVPKEIADMEKLIGIA